MQFGVGIGSDDAADRHEEAGDLVSIEQGAEEEADIPKGGTGSEHILAQRPHDSVRTSSVSENVDGA